MPSSTANRSMAMGPISYIIDQCAYGKLLVARTSKGVCAILLGSSSSRDEWLVRDLARRFPHNRLSKNALDQSHKLGEDVSLIQKAMQDPQLAWPTSEQLSLDLRAGTPHQLAVWKALTTIPVGKTLTYAQLARRAGLAPSSVRAVASACGANHLAFIVPCHRIVRSDGALGGYHWGSATKHEMLSKERIPLSGQKVSVVAAES